MEIGRSVGQLMRMSPDNRLATYGSLAPGKPNHHQLSDLSGRWIRGSVAGSLVQTGWGAALGFPALVLDENGARVQVDLFESDDLPHHWARLDAFEGDGYRRVAVQIETDDGELPAFIYVAADQHAGD